MAKKKDIVEDVVVEEKPEESTDIEAVEESQEEITEDKLEESQPDEEKSPVIDEVEEDKPEEITLDEVKPDDELPPIEVIDNNNKVINNDAIGDVEVPKGFAPMPKVDKIGTMGSVNGRLYKVISKTHAIWCDNGAAFLLSNLK